MAESSCTCPKGWAATPMHGCPIHDAGLQRAPAAEAARPEITTPLYFGCWGDVGHFMWTPRGRRPPKEFAWHPYPGLPWNHIDAQFAPVHGTRRDHSNDEAPQGQAALIHKDGWTALAFWDRTVDSRGNSSSTFLFDAELDFDQALAAAREHFPTVVQRVESAGMEIVPFEAGSRRV